MSNQTTLFHGGAYEITKASEPEAGLIVQVFDMEEDASSVAPMTPAEWDTFVAAGNAALGRPSTPLESRLLAAIEATDEHAETGWSIGAEAEDVAAVKGKATGLRAALAMVREQGATVPRAGVEALRARLLAVDSGMEDIIIDAFDALLAAPTTQTEKG